MSEAKNQTWESVESRVIDGLHLKCTCSFCPEQYDVFDGGKQVAYMRLRHGEFRVDFPDIVGVAIFLGNPFGDGQFESDEREAYLTAAIAEVRRWMAMSAEERKQAEALYGFVRVRPHQPNDLLNTIDRLQTRVDELEKHLATTIEMKTK